MTITVDAPAYPRPSRPLPSAPHHGARIAVRRNQPAAETAPKVRCLLFRTLSYSVRTDLFAEVLAQSIRKEHLRSSPAQVTTWVMAMFDAKCVGGMYPTEGVEAFSLRVQKAAIAAGPARADLSKAVKNAVQSVYGQQMQVTGWLPGFRVMESSELVTLTGDACPQCFVNPLVREQDGLIGCLNSEECGCVVSPAPASKKQKSRS